MTQGLRSTRSCMMSYNKQVWGPLTLHRLGVDSRLWSEDHSPRMRVESTGGGWHADMTWLVFVCRRGRVGCVVPEAGSRVLGLLPYAVWVLWSHSGLCCLTSRLRWSLSRVSVFLWSVVMFSCCFFVCFPSLYFCLSMFVCLCVCLTDCRSVCLSLWH